MEQPCQTAIIQALAKKYQISIRYVRYCLKDERSPPFAEKLKMDYERILKKIVIAIKEENL